MGSLFSDEALFIELQQVESTNNYATALVHEGMARHGTVVFAHCQTKGKGQRQKKWQSEPGKNIALSLIIKPFSLSLSQGFLISMATALAAYRFVSYYCGDEAKIKWPNDIYWRDRKAAGILIENVVQGTEWKWSIIGIGVNVNQTAFPDVPTKTTSLKQITGKTFEPVALSKELCKYVREAYEQLQASQETIHPDYKAALFMLDKNVVFRQGPRVFSGMVKNVTPAGQLIVQTALEESFGVGELEWILS